MIKLYLSYIIVWEELYMKCEYCGKELPLGTTVCDGCGAITKVI